MCFVVSRRLEQPGKILCVLCGLCVVGRDRQYLIYRALLGPRALPAGYETIRTLVGGKGGAMSG